MLLRSLTSVFFAALTGAHAAEGIPHWSRVIDDVLARAEREAASPAPQPSAAPPAPVPHASVAAFVDYYRTRGSQTWASSLKRLAGIRPAVEQIFTEEGVPSELLWLGLVESGYNARAVSPKNAAGVWQFIPDTARRFGLVVDARRDDRSDTAKATRAAARYLRFLYGTFGDWQLALAAYNAGEARVQSAIDRAGTRDFWALAQSGHLPRETQAYVPAVLAAQILGDGGAVPSASPVRTARKTVQAPFSLSP